MLQLIKQHKQLYLHIYDKGDAMAQVTIYMNNNLEEKIKTIAQSMNISISKFIATSLEQQLKEEWPNSIKKLSGSWDDFADLKEIKNSSTQDVPRVEF